MSVDKTHLDNLRIDRGSDARAAGKPLWTVVGIGVVLLLALGIWLLVRPARAVVRVAPATAIQTGGRSTVLNATGYVTARRQATVSSKFTGRVVEVLIEEGMRVDEGQILARLDAAIQAAAFRLAQAEATAAASELEETRVRIEEARLDMQRAGSLAQQQISSAQDFDRARAQHNALKARLVAQGDSLAVARRQVQLRQQDVEDAVIRAPFAGIVVSKNAQPGEMISPISAGGGFTRTGICTIVDMDSLEIEVDVNEAYINRVQTGMPVEAVLDAYPDWRIPAHVITVIPTADRQKATVKVRIGFDQKDPRILPDMGVKVGFIESAAPAASQQPAVTVPKSALRRDGDQDIVFVVRDGSVERRAVKVASTEAERVQLASGVNESESVVIEGPAELKDGDRVTVEETGNR
ncbi:MAG TPA: efflux RND transporter periplasmic adaptor subunit [Thermoanaerobaculia bacterium]|nr:efflux RND transporter periplasmic adaptor subunit [Thermoanaerobaculia bacterium]